MSTLVQLVSVLAWPAVTVWFLWRFGNDLKKLVLRLSHLKISGAEAFFQEQLERVEELSEGIGGNAALPNNNIAFEEKYAQLIRIADVSPRAAIMESWLLIEEAAGKAGFTNGVSIPRVNPMMFIDSLLQDGKITTETADLVRKMRKLRNEASHLGEFELTKSEAERYLKVAVQISLMISESTSCNN